MISRLKKFYESWGLMALGVAVVGFVLYGGATDTIHSGHIVLVGAFMLAVVMVAKDGEFRI